MDTAATDRARAHAHGGVRHRGPHEPDPAADRLWRRESAGGSARRRKRVPEGRTAWNRTRRISRGPGFGPRQIFRETASFFSVPTPAADQRTGARAPSPPHARGLPAAPGSPRAGRGASPQGARSSSRRSSSRSSSRSRRSCARGASTSPPRGTPARPTPSPARSTTSPWRRARAASSPRGRGRATARSIHALRARRPGRRGVPPTRPRPIARRRRPNVAASSPGERRRRDPPTPSKRSKRPRRRRGSAGEGAHAVVPAARTGASRTTHRPSSPRGRGVCGGRHWFGAMPPPQLRRAEARFPTAAALVAEVATATAELRALTGGVTERERERERRGRTMGGWGRG